MFITSGNGSENFGMEHFALFARRFCQFTKLVEPLSK